MLKKWTLPKLLSCVLIIFILPYSSFKMAALTNLNKNTTVRRVHFLEITKIASDLPSSRSYYHLKSESVIHLYSVYVCKTIAQNSIYRRWESRVFFCGIRLYTYFFPLINIYTTDITARFFKSQPHRSYIIFISFFSVPKIHKLPTTIYISTDLVKYITKQ